MQKDDIIVTHEGKQYLVENGRLVPFTEHVIELPEWAKTPEGYNHWMAGNDSLSDNRNWRTAAMRDDIIKYMQKHDPYMNL